jgi:hypothetical protein
MTQQELIKEIEEFNALLDRCTKSLERFLPKSVMDQITGVTKEQEEHDRLISFSTKVDYISDFFINESEKYDKKLKDRISEVKKRSEKQ